MIGKRTIRGEEEIIELKLHKITNSKAFEIQLQPRVNILKQMQWLQYVKKKKVSTFLNEPMFL